MMKAILVEEILPGDVVCPERDIHITVKSATLREDGVVVVMPVDPSRVICYHYNRYRVVGLLHRPNNRVAKGALDVALLLRSAYDEKNEERLTSHVLPHLREAIEVYELGKPLAVK